LFTLAKTYHDNSQLCSWDMIKTNHDFLSEKNRKFIELILNGHMITIAYDCDSNFEPCFKNGKNAHWALIHGFIYGLDYGVTINEENLDSLKFSSNCLQLGENSEYKHCLEQINFERFYVIAKHGKSKHSAIWNLKQLLLSNAQLNVANDKFLNPNEYIVPLNGIFETLSYKYLVID
jgi:hypothetical protein